MNTTKIIKLIIAGVIAILLTGGILYVKLKQADKQEVAVPVSPVSEKAPSIDQQLLDSISAPVSSEQKTEAQKTADAKVLESLSASSSKEKTPAQQKADADVLNSLSAPKK
jgi:hypothetical protein